MIKTKARQSVSISLPPDLANEVDRVARAEKRSRSAVMRGAFRQYIQGRKEWDQIFAYGEAKGRELGLKSEEDVNRLIKEYRQEKRTAAG